MLDAGGGPPGGFCLNPFLFPPQKNPIWCPSRSAPTSRPGATASSGSPTPRPTSTATPTVRGGGAGDRRWGQATPRGARPPELSPPAAGCTDDIMTSDHSPVFGSFEVGVTSQFVSKKGGGSPDTRHTCGWPVPTPAGTRGRPRGSPRLPSPRRALQVLGAGVHRVREHRGHREDGEPHQVLHRVLLHLPGR